MPVGFLTGKALWWLEALCTVLSPGLVSMILVSYIFRIKDETFCTSKNYTFWVVTGLVSSYSAYKMNTHGMSIVAGYFMTVFQAKTWYRITFNLKPHEFKIFRSWTYFMLPFVSEEYESHLAIMMMMIWWWWWLIRERAYDNNIRKILKYFQKQRVWWEHRNILEKLEISELFPRIEKMLFLIKSVSRWLRFVGFSHSPRISFFLSLQRQSRASPTLKARATPEFSSCFTKSVSGDLFVD